MCSSRRSAISRGRSAISANSFSLMRRRSDRIQRCLPLMFQTNEPYMLQLYYAAAILAVLVCSGGSPDDLQQPEQQCGPADEVLRDAPVPRRGPEADPAVCQTGGSRMVQERNPGRIDL